MEHYELNLFAFTDYRSYLRAYHEGKKKTRPSWSYATWARHLNLKSPSTLVMILRGQRHPGPHLVRSLAHQMKLNPEQNEYFSDLVRLQKSQADVRLSVLLMERLNRKHSSGQFHYLEPDVFQAISHWHYYAIRELVNVKDFEESPSWISRRLRFRVSPKEAADALTTLVRLNLLKRNEDGRLVPATGHLGTQPDFAAEAVKQFHEQMLKNAQESVRQVAVSEREFMGTTFAVSQRNLPKAKELIRKFHNEFCDLLEEQGADSLYHLEIGFFPLTRNSGGCP